VFLYNRQVEALNEVNAKTQVPISVLIRQGVDLILERHGRKPAKPRKRSAGS
jgi:Ribbon-helix-helix domain